MTPKAGRSKRRAPFAVAAWAGATALASGVAWLGVDSVLLPAAETAPAVLSAGQTAAVTAPPALVISLPSPSRSAGPPSAPASKSPEHSLSASPSQSPAAHGSPSAPASSSPPPSPTSSTARYDTAGGSVVLAMTETDAKLVSATPAAGYSVMNWSAAGWLRVDFSQGSTTYSVFVTWNGHPPQVQIVETGQ